MKNNLNSDPDYHKYVDTDFSSAKPVAEIPTLARLQAEYGNKTTITIQIDSDTLAIFKARAEITGDNYQILINNVLKQFAHAA